MDISVGEEFPAYYEDTSEASCPICEGKMTRGMEECVGVCDKCYDSFLTEANALCADDE